MYHRRPCCWQVSLEHLWLFGSPFSPHRPPAQPKSSTEPWLGSTAFNHKAYTSCSISLAALFASPLIVSQCVLVSTTCAHKAEAGEHLEEEGSMAAAFARPVGEGKRTPIGFRSRSWNFRILRGAPLAQKQKGNASVCRQPRHANRGGDAKQQVSWRPGTLREPVGSSRRVATGESNGRKHTFSIPVFHCKPLWPQATPTNAPEKKTRLSTSRYGFRCLAFN